MVGDKTIVQSVMSELAPYIPAGEAQLQRWLETSVGYHVGHARSGRLKWAITLSGKDSLTETFIAWMSMRHLRRHGFPVTMTVVHNDTMVEDPVLHAVMVDTLHWMQKQAAAEELPVSIRLVQPPLERRPFYQIFVKGYPAPNRQFRYCTRSWKTSPTNEALLDEAPDILALGVRRNESQARDRRLQEQDRIRAVECTLGGSECGQDVLLKQESGLLPNTLRIAPIEHWTSVQEIWVLLREIAPKFGWPSAALEKAYPADESRLGCWLCTLVTRNLSLEDKVREPEFSKYQCLLDWRERYQKMCLDPNYRSLKNAEEVQMGEQVALVGEVSCLTYEARNILYQAWLDAEETLGQELMDPESREHVEAELRKDIKLPPAFMHRLVLRRKQGGMSQQKWAL